MTCTLTPTPHWETALYCFARQHLLRWFQLPISHTHTHTHTGCPSFAADFFPLIGDGKLPQRPYTRTRRRANTHRAPQRAPPADSSQCAQRSATACTTCKRLRRTAEACCALGHHAEDHIARRPELQLCPLHGLPPCLRCTLKQRGVRHCCQRGHHKVCTPVPVRRKRPLTQSQLPNK